MPMVHKLRKKFVVTALSSFLIILVLVIGFINVAGLIQTDRRTAGLMETLLENDGYFPDPGFPGPAGKPSGQDSYGPHSPFSPFETTRRIEAPFETRYFFVRVDDAGSVMETFLERIASVTEETAGEYAASVLSGSRTSGYLGTFKYGVRDLPENEKLLVFIDCSSAFSQAFSLFLSSLGIGLVLLLLTAVLVFALSGRAVSPVVESLEKQKRFISDAGHELKTPLSVISANTDVLELTGVKNEWTESIRRQTKRMSALVNDLLTLSRMEEDGAGRNRSDVDFSRIVQESAKSFTAVAAAGGRIYETQVTPGIHLTGDPSLLERLCTILLDNAMKYSPEGGRIRLTLKKDRKIRLIVSNTCERLDETDLNRLFDRFYRADTSRNNAGGFGLGLSAALAICTSHKGTIKASREGSDTIVFEADFPV